jgi:hypothetical protein
MTASKSDDVQAIARLLENAFDAISWTPEKAPDWATFFAPYLDGANLVPSARPAVLTDPDTFRTRMDAQRDDGALSHLEEQSAGLFVKVFGSIAIAANAFRGQVNRSAEIGGVNMYLLVKTDGGWKIACVAWDNSSPDQPIPEEFLARP